MVACPSAERQVEVSRESMTAYPSPRFGSFHHCVGCIPMVYLKCFGNDDKGFTLIGV